MVFIVGMDIPRMTTWNPSGWKEKLKFILVLLLSSCGILHFLFSLTVITITLHYCHQMISCIPDVIWWERYFHFGTFPPRTHSHCLTMVVVNHTSVEEHCITIFDQIPQKLKAIKKRRQLNCYRLIETIETWQPNVDHKTSIRERKKGVVDGNTDEVWGECCVQLVVLYCVGFEKLNTGM